MESHDLVVIGAGPGGYPAAIRAAQLGARVAIIEKEQLGGVCLNWGCIPTKTLIEISRLYAELRNAQHLGINVGETTVDFTAMRKHKNDVVARLRKGVEQLMKANGIVVYLGEASFKGRNRIRIKRAVAAGDSPRSLTLRTTNTIIATGSASAMPPFLPRHERVVDSRAFLDLSKLPRQLLVLGGGYIGCELACMAARLGSEVTVVELLDDILLQLDRDARREVRKYMEKTLRIRILTGKPIAGITVDTADVRGSVGNETVTGDMLLATVGRTPVTDGLELEKAGLETNDDGFIEVDEYGRTRVATIYAVGDVVGGLQLAPEATSEGIIAAENACGHTLRRNETVVPSVIFTAPEVATVGLSESEAGKLGQNIRVGKFPFRALGRAVTVNHTEGFVKWLADTDSGRLLGAIAVGTHATGLIAEAAVAIRNELTAEELARTIHGHPTFSEIWSEAARKMQGRWWR